MKSLQFIKKVADKYFFEKDALWSKQQIFWKLTFIAFFSLYLLQIYANYNESLAIYNLGWIDADKFWALRISALKIEAIVLFGVFLRFLSSLFRGNWAIRFGEVGTLFAFFAFCKHMVLSREIESHFNSCASPNLIGMIPLASQLIGIFFLSWFIYKIIFIIAVIWKTVRK